MVMTRDDPQRPSAPRLPHAAQVTDPTGQGSLSTSDFGPWSNSPLRTEPFQTVVSAYRWVAFYHAPAPLDAIAAASPEMRQIESDPQFYGRLITRLNRPGRLIPAEDIVGGLDSDDEP